MFKKSLWEYFKTEIFKFGKKIGFRKLKSKAYKNIAFKKNPLKIPMQNSQTIKQKNDRDDNFIVYKNRQHEKEENCSFVWKGFVFSFLQCFYWLLHTNMYKK